MAYVLIRIVAYISLGLVAVIAFLGQLLAFPPPPIWQGIIETVYVVVGLIPHKYVVKNTVFYWAVMCFFVAMFGFIALWPCMLQVPLALYMSRVRFIEAHRSQWRRHNI